MAYIKVETCDVATLYECVPACICKGNGNTPTNSTPTSLSLSHTLSYWTHFPPNPLGGVKPHPGTQHYKCQKVEKRRKKILSDRVQRAGTNEMPHIRTCHSQMRHASLTKEGAARGCDVNCGHGYNVNGCGWLTRHWQHRLRGTSFMMWLEGCGAAAHRKWLLPQRIWLRPISIPCPTNQVEAVAKSKQSPLKP